MNCPRCGLALLDRSGNFVCTACGGAFLPAQAHESVARALDDATQRAVQAATARAKRTPTTAPPASCPQCKTVMDRFAVGDVDVDTCQAHGTWYDKGELARVAETLRSSAPPSSAGQPPGASGLELDERAQPNAPPSARRPSGRIDPRVQEKINALARQEQREERRRQRFDDYGPDGTVTALELVDDILGFLRR